MKHLLDNIMWHSLTGPHAPYSAGTATARRYAVGFSPLIGFADPANPDFGSLAAHCIVWEKLAAFGGVDLGGAAAAAGRGRGIRAGRAPHAAHDRREG